jgi:hypothetical protein
MKRWRILTAGIAGWLALGPPGRAGEGTAGMRASKPEVRTEVVAVIEAQLAAFRAGELKKAHGYGSAALRAQRPLRAFVAIVQNSYPEIFTNTRAEFGLVRDDGQQAMVRVHVFAKEGDAAYDYGLVKERAGWRISSVLPHDARGADRV